MWTFKMWGKSHMNSQTTTAIEGFTQVCIYTVAFSSVLYRTPECVNESFSPNKIKSNKNILKIYNKEGALFIGKEQLSSI